MADRNHGTVIDPAAPGAASKEVDREQLGELILSALRTDAEDYDTLARAWYDLSEDTASLAASGDARLERFGDDRPEDVKRLS